MKILRLLVMAWLCCCSSLAWASKGRILYIPMDNRPVCLAYTVATMEAAGWQVLTPPEEYLATATESANSEKLFQWLEENASTSLASVISTDALLYGGLVGSRTHDLPAHVIEERALRLLSLKSQFKAKRVYGFTTIMRSPKASSAPVEPAYYGQWGPKLFALGALEDKAELVGLKRKERRQLKELGQELPPEHLRDLYGRREKNLQATELLLEGLLYEGLDYLLVGRDDTATYSRAHLEARRLAALVKELPQERLGFFAGADQLGLVLLTRVANKLEYKIPLVKIIYNKGAGGATIPSYEDNTVATSAKDHVLAVGGYPAQFIKHADLVLAVNTPVDGKTADITQQSPSKENARQVEDFLGRLAMLDQQGYKIALADVKYGNGADNMLVEGLFQRALAYRLASYGGWNTAGNSLGFALGQGLLARSTSSKEHRQLLEQRYLDDWAYEAGARLTVYQSLIWPRYWPGSGLKGEQLQAAEERVSAAIKDKARPYLGEQVEAYTYILPWQRLFEVYVQPKPEAAEPLIVNN